MHALAPYIRTHAALKMFHLASTWKKKNYILLATILLSGLHILRFVYCEQLYIK